MKFWRVKHDQELDGRFRPCEVQPTSLEQVFTPWPLVWQLAAFELLQSDIAAWRYLYLSTRAFTNQKHGWDYRRDYIQNLNADAGDMAIEGLLCGGQIVTGSAVNGLLVVDTLDINDDPPLDFMPWHLIYPTVSTQIKLNPKIDGYKFRVNPFNFPGCVFPLVTDHRNSPPMTISLDKLAQLPDDSPSFPSPFLPSRGPLTNPTVPSEPPTPEPEPVPTVNIIVPARTVYYKDQYSGKKVGRFNLAFSSRVYDSQNGRRKVYCNAGPAAQNGYWWI